MASREKTEQYIDLTQRQSNVCERKSQISDRPPLTHRTRPPAARRRGEGEKRGDVGAWKATSIGPGLIDKIIAHR